ncbi:MAG: DUF4928 family protein [Pirellulales bacterium]|nr:DUF4928 family protein [Pirellulales bacterium]
MKNDRKLNVEQHCKSFSDWLDKHMMLGDSDQPGRLVVLMALLERLREKPNLDESLHLTKSKMQLQDHNKYVAQSLDRFNIGSPLKEFGRRASNVGGWIGPLFDWLKPIDFSAMPQIEREQLLENIGLIAAARIKVVSEGKPLIARYNKGTAVAVIVDILDQAQEKRRAKDVAEYLVGAKLQVKFGDNAAEPKNVNTPNRGQPADFFIGTTAIEVTVNPPDARHLNQIVDIVNNTGYDVWLLVRRSDREKWQNAVDVAIEEQFRFRVAVTDVETFVGQNVSELAKFERPLTVENLKEVVKTYNERWLPTVGSSGLRIVSAEPELDRD